MRRFLAVGLVTFLALAAPSGAGAQPAPPPILDLAALPPMAAAGRTSYENRFLLGDLPRAFAIASNGAYGANWGGTSVEAVRGGALKSCADKGGRDCAIYAENLDVVWPGRPPVVRRSVPGPLIADRGYAFVPDVRYFWNGPAAARGLYVWGHGYGAADARGLQTQPYVRAFNDAGFDVVRFDREQPWDDSDRAEGWLRAALPQFRRMGWKTIIVGGQSRGAWNALQMLDTPGLADVVIAMSPAANGLDPGSQILFGETDLYRMFTRADAPATRVAIVQFTDDPFAGNEDRRLGMIDRLLKPRVGPLLTIDRPDGFSGHFGGNEPRFAERYASCLLHFATDPTPKTAC